MNASDLAAALGGRKTSRGWRAPCPAHDDRHPSLDITETPDGRVLFICRAGCSQTEVIDALRARGLVALIFKLAAARPASTRSVAALYRTTRHRPLLSEVVPLRALGAIQPHLAARRASQESCRGMSRTDRKTRTRRSTNHTRNITPGHRVRDSIRRYRRTRCGR